MSYEKIKSIEVQENKVFLTSKSNNDTEPFKRWECNGLTEEFKLSGIDRLKEIVDDEFKSGNFRGNRKINFINF